MAAHLKNIANQLQAYNAIAQAQDILPNTPWVLIDERYVPCKIILKIDQKMILSTKGKAIEGKWEYFEKAKSLLLVLSEKKEDTYLCNILFLDSGFAILKLDGTQDRYSILANENQVSNLEIEKFMKAYRYEKLNILEVPIKDGRILEVHRDPGDEEAEIDNPVSIEAISATDGRYSLVAPNNQAYLIKKGIIVDLLLEKPKKAYSSEDLIVQQQSFWRLRTGDFIIVNREPFYSGTIQYTKHTKLHVKNGVIFEKESPNIFLNIYYRLQQAIFPFYMEDQQNGLST